MERTMSVEDKIRRAEEIYNRRRENEFKVGQVRRVEVNNDVTNQNINRKLKKMIVQIVICMLVYLVFHYATNSNNLFSEDFRKKCQEILEYDISFSETYKRVFNNITVLKERYEGILNKSEEENNVDKNLQQNEQESSNEIIQDSIQQKNEQSTEKEIQETTNNLTIEENNNQEQENIGGATVSVTQNSEEIAETTENLTEEEQMKKDAEYIKSKISFIKPLEGRITSVFGWRNPTVSTVSKYHTGIDIAANQGTDIISATSGKVVLSSSEGPYGNHLKIQIDDVVIIYAHCLSLKVQEGEEIIQGQVIAKVGSTGNSTGPHLHFEIRKEDRYVNPDLILEFK